MKISTTTTSPTPGTYTKVQLERIQRKLEARQKQIKERPECLLANKKLPSTPAINKKRIIEREPTSHTLNLRHHSFPSFACHF